MLISASVRAPETAEELLTPGVAALLDRLDVQSRKLRSGKLPGERRSKRRGQSVEFDDFRPYVVGDDIRHLDWNAFARLDRFVIKLFRAEEDLAVTIVLDGSASMYAGEGETAGGEPLDSKLVYAARLAMGLGSIALARQNRVSVLRFGGSRLGRLPACRGRRSIERLGRFLLDGLHEPFDPAASRHDFNGWLKEVGRSRRGRGVVVLLSDLLVRGDALPGLRSLVAADRAGTDGAVLRVLSPSELDPASAGERTVRGDLRLEDIEGGLSAEVTVTRELIKRYRENFARHETALRRACSRIGLSYHTLTTAERPADALGGAMRRVGLLG